MQEPVEVGSIVKKGDLLAQIDPRDVKNKFDQAMADDVVSRRRRSSARSAIGAQGLAVQCAVITAAANDSTKSTYAAAVSDMISKRANLDLARQGLEDATVQGADRRHHRLSSRDPGQIITAATPPTAAPRS